MTNNLITTRNIFDNTDVLVSLSAGHGGIFNGKYVTAPDKMMEFKQQNYTFYEGAFNRQMVMHIVKYLHHKRISYDFINNTYEDIHPSRRGKTCDVALSNSKLKYGFGVEIHANYFPNPLAKGFEIYTSKGLTPADGIATNIYNTVKESKLVNMRPGITKKDPDVDKEANFAFLISGRQPLVLIECDFFNTYDRVQRLMDPIFQDNMARAIANGIEESIKNKSYV